MDLPETILLSLGRDGDIDGRVDFRPLGVLYLFPTHGSPSPYLLLGSLFGLPRTSGPRKPPTLGGASGSGRGLTPVPETVDPTWG